MKFKNLIISLLPMILGTKALAQVNPKSSELYEAKAKLEQLITERYKNTISTTLEKDAYDVSVQVNLVPVPPKKTDEVVVDNKKTDQATAQATAQNPQTPFDLTVGLVNADALIQKYEQEIQELKDQQKNIVQSLAQKQPESIETKYTVSSVMILVGLSPELGSKYSSELRTWLQKKVTADFGNIGKAEVEMIKAKPKAKPEPKEEKTFWDQVSSVQHLLGQMIFGLALIFTVLLWKMMASKDSQEQRQMTIQMNNETQRSAPAPAPAAVASAETDKPARLAVDTEVQERNARDIMGKITWIAIESAEQMTSVFHTWLEMGDKGRLKTACLLDVLATHAGTKQFQEHKFNLSWEQIIPTEHQRSMNLIFEKMKGLDFNQRTELLNEVYWDLISMKTLGSKSLNRPFGYASSLIGSQVRGLISGQNPQMKALFVMHLPEIECTKVMKTLDVSDKKSILESSLSMDKVLSTDIEAASEALKFEVKRMIAGDGVVSVQAMVPKLLNALTPMEELTILMEIAGNMSDGGNSIKQNIPSLAFVHEWPKEAASLLWSSASADEVLTYLRFVPKMTDTVLSYCSPMVQTIVRDDLAKPDMFNEDMKTRFLTTLKTKLLQFVNQGSVNLGVIFDQQHDQGPMRAAS